MKETAFLPIHREYGARLVEFGGYLMPVSYAGIMQEHAAVRSAAGLFDVSHMGEFDIAGPDAMHLVQKVTVNDVSKLVPGKAQYSAMCTPEGGIVDDLLVYHMGNSFMLVVNAANRAGDLEWVHAAAGGLDVTIDDRSDQISLLALQGPKSADILQPLTGTDLASIGTYAWSRGKIDGVDVLLSRTGYTGESGFELYFDSSPASARAVWDAIMASGKPHGLLPVGLGARDTLRLEMAYCLYGNDIGRTTNPLEAGLGWITKLEKGEFIGRDALLEARRSGVRRKLTGFLPEDAKALPRPHYKLAAGGNVVGEVTSGTISPTLGRGIGLGYVPAEYAVPGKRISVFIRDREVPATTVATPFVKKAS